MMRHLQKGERRFGGGDGKENEDKKYNDDSILTCTPFACAKTAVAGVFGVLWLLIFGGAWPF